MRSASARRRSRLEQLRHHRHRVAGAVLHRLGDARVTGPAFAPGARSLPRLDLRTCCSLKGFRAVCERVGTLLTGAQPQPFLGLGTARGGGLGRQPVTFVGGRLLLAGLLQRGSEPLPEVLQLGTSGLQLLLGLGVLGLQPLPLRLRAADHLPELAELLGDGRHPGVGLVEPLQRRVDSLAELDRLGACLLSRELRLLLAAGRLLDLVAGLVHC